MMQKNAEAVYLISRTQYNTYASFFNGSELSLLQKDGETMPAYLDSLWADAETTSGFRTRLGIPSEGRCIATCEYGPFFESSAAVFKQQLENAGFPNVKVVADIDAVMAYYEHAYRALSKADPKKGVIIFHLRGTPGYGEDDSTAILKATLCRAGTIRTDSVAIYDNEYHTSFESPDSFFEELHNKWGDVSALLYHGYYSIEDKMVQCISRCFKDTPQYFNWAEIKPDHRMNLHRGLELLVCSNEGILMHPLDHLFRNLFLPPVKHISDTGRYIFEAINQWINREGGRKPLLSRAEACLNEGLERITGFNPYWKEKKYLEDAEKIAACCEEAFMLPRYSIPSELFVDHVQRLYEDLFSSQIQALLQSEMYNRWQDWVSTLQDSTFRLSRVRQIIKQQDMLRIRRREDRKAVLSALVAQLNLPALRDRFIREVLQVVRSIPETSAGGIHHHLMHAKELIIIDLPYADFSYELRWRESDACPGVDTEYPSSFCEAADSREGTPWWESID